MDPNMSQVNVLEASIRLGNSFIGNLNDTNVSLERDRNLTSRCQVDAPIRANMRSPNGIIDELMEKNEGDVYQDLDEGQMEACPYC